MEVENNRTEVSFFLNATEEKKKEKDKTHTMDVLKIKHKGTEVLDVFDFWFLLIFLSFVSGFVCLTGSLFYFEGLLLHVTWSGFTFYSFLSRFPLTHCCHLLTCLSVSALCWGPQWCTMRLTAQRAVSSLTSEFSMSGKLLVSDLAKSPW